MAVTAQSLTPPLCVDLDGALIHSDLLLESTLALIRRNPLYLFLIPLWLLRGKSVLKAEIAARVALNPATLPYNRELIQWLKSERATGRSLWLHTATNMRLAESVAAELGIFDGVLASDASTDLAGVPRDAFPRRGTRLKPLIRAIRPHQWAKNVLVLVPLLAAHRVGDLASLLSGALAVASFCFCASSVYVLNDLLDLEADRAHPRKAKRPFAAGELSIATGFGLIVALLAASVLLAAFLPPKFQLVLAAYYALTASYSLVLKGIMLIDAVALAGLYTLRIIAGAAAVTVALSFWLLLFSVFLFLSLAFVKRYAELDALRRQLRLKALGRGYTVEDLPVLQSLGTASGYLSVLVLALYINSPAIESLYHRPKAVWLLCVLMLYWISRVWMKVHRGEMHDDPVVFALRDRVSLALGVLAAATVAIAI